MKSIVTEYTEICAVCGRPKECEHHLVFGNGLRDLGTKDGLLLPMCNRCHNMSNHCYTQIHDNPMAETLSKMVGQLAWEKNFYRTSEVDTARIAFMKRYGRSWL